ncbi:fibronectin type III domain-containing protein [Streptomyces sp. NPDC048275]|uniref:fibronectin type III domain-containing protein n=1 Tax=Streptomyces sp. NPDC048275 TaxID=3155629 RepID=UPI0033DB2E9A
MKLGHAMAAAVLLTPILFVGMTEPATARNTHAVVIAGSLHVDDYGGDDAVRFFREVVNLTHDKPKAWPVIEQCAGGETRGTLSIELRLNNSETLYARPGLYLHEESTCNNNDLDGIQLPRSRTIAMGKEVSWHLIEQNGEPLSYDKVTASFTVTHTIGADVGRPNEPSGVIAEVLPTRGLCAVFGANCRKTVTVTWQDNASNETGYEIRNTEIRETQPQTTVRLAPNTTKFSWSDLDPKVKHCFQVRAVGDRGPSDWTPVGIEVECA